jgi:(2Fe-2S) ferredoxin
VAALQRLVASDPAMVGTVAITPCGCLGPCFEGPIAVRYPDGSWIAGAAVDDAEALREWLAGGDPPSRLVHDWPDED